MSGLKTNLPIDKSATCKKELMKLYNGKVWNRWDNKENKFCEKGTSEEDEGFKLISRVLKEVLIKQETRKSNDFFTCITDNKREGITLDLKCSWSLTTFSEAITTNIESDYLYQGNVQMDVEEVEQHWLVYALVNNSARLIEKEINNLQYRLEPWSEQWESAAIQIEINNIFEMDLFRENNPDYVHILPVHQWEYDIPIDRRVFKFEFQKDPAIVQAMKERVINCRQWMNTNLFKI